MGQLLPWDKSKDLHVPYLTPAPWRKTQIHNGHSRFEKSIPIVDLEQLEGRTALEPLDLGRTGELVPSLSISPSSGGREACSAR